MEGGAVDKWWINLAPLAHTRPSKPLTEDGASHLLALTPPAETFEARARRLYAALAEARVYAPSANWLWARVKIGASGWACRGIEAMIAPVPRAKRRKHLSIVELDRLEAALLRIRAELIALGEPGNRRRPRRGTMHSAAKEAAKKT